jgi:hypothetical protein
MPFYARLLTWFFGDLTSLRAIPTNGGWLMAAGISLRRQSRCFCRFRFVVALFFTSLRMVPFMLMLDKDTPASMAFGGDV